MEVIQVKGRVYRRQSRINVLSLKKFNDVIVIPPTTPTPPFQKSKILLLQLSTDLLAKTFSFPLFTLLLKKKNKKVINVYGTDL